MKKKDELNKYFQNSETVEIWRSQITPAPYNPRTINDENRKALRRGIRKYGVIGGMVWNTTTTNLVSGHQKLRELDDLNKYNSETKENDYKLKVEKIEVDIKTEKELNILFNNPNTQGDWDYNALREMIPDIDYKDAGLTDEDLSLIGIDFTVQTEEEESLADALEELTEPIQEQKEAKREAVREMKQKIKEEAEEKVREMDSYVMVNFDSYEAKAKFMLRFGFNAPDKFVQGEYLEKLIDELS